MPRGFGGVFGGALLLLAVGAAVGAGHAAYRPLSFGLAAKGDAESDETREGFISLADAKAAFDSGRALFLDAGSEAQFGRRRIVGSLNLPASAFSGGAFPDLVMELPRSGMSLIVYCRGGCDTAILVAQYLQEAGFPETVVLESGLESWVAAGHPVEP